MSRHIIRDYFPNTDNNERHLAYTFDTIMTMSKRIDAEIISGIIIENLKILNINYENVTITDATAGIGGNTFSFLNLFKHVNSVEKD